MRHRLKYFTNVRHLEAISNKVLVPCHEKDMVIEAVVFLEMFLSASDGLGDWKKYILDPDNMQWFRDFSFVAAMDKMTQFYESTFQKCAEFNINNDTTIDETKSSINVILTKISVLHNKICTFKNNGGDGTSLRPAEAFIAYIFGPGKLSDLYQLPVSLDNSYALEFHQHPLKWLRDQCSRHMKTLQQLEGWSVLHPASIPSLQLSSQLTSIISSHPAFTPSPSLYPAVLAELYHTFPPSDVLYVFKAFELIHNMTNGELKKAILTCVEQDLLTLDANSDISDRMRKKIMSGIKTTKGARVDNNVSAPVTVQSIAEGIRNITLVENKDRDTSTSKGKMTAACGLSYLNHDPLELQCSRGGTNTGETDPVCQTIQDKCVYTAKDLPSHIGLKDINSYYSHRKINKP